MVCEDTEIREGSIMYFFFNIFIEKKKKRVYIYTVHGLGSLGIKKEQNGPNGGCTEFQCDLEGVGRADGRFSVPKSNRERIKSRRE